MSNTDLTRYHRCLPFSNVVTNLTVRCCASPSLYSSARYKVFCISCAERHQPPPGIAPFVSPSSSLSEHIANGHLLICTVCSLRLSLASDRTESHIQTHLQACQDRLANYTPKPHMCSMCRTIMWLQKKPSK